MPSKIKRLQDFCDMDKLYSMLDNWAMSTGMSVSIIDNQGELISDVFGMSDYCKMVRSIKKGKEDCKSCIQRANGLFLCHAGFCEFSSMISLPDGTILGKVLAGQVLSEIQKDDQLLNIATALGIHEDKAKKCIARLKRRSFKEMEGAYSLLDDMIHFFIEDRYSIWKAKQENQEEKYRQMQTIQAFSSIYFATWSIDLERNYVESIKELDFVRPLAEVTDRTVSDAIHMLIERSIPDQKEMMRDKLNMSEIIKQLEKSEKVELEYCDFAIGWCRITIIPIEKNKEQRVSKLLIGIQSIEAEKKKEQKATTELKEINEVATKYNAFHDAITQKNICEYYVDLRDNTFHSFKVDDSLLKAFQSSKDWDELVKYYLDHHVFQESKADVARIYDRNYVIKKLDSKNRKLSVDSKVMLDGKPRWVRNTVTLSSVDGGGRPSHVVVLVRDISKEKEAEELKARYLKIMAALSMDYDSVFYVNLDENLLTVIQSSSAFDIIRKDMGVINYDENVKRLINNVVDEEDALDLLEFVKRDNLINLLKSKKDFSYRFRVCSNSQDDKVFELHFVDVSQKYGEHILVAGSRCIDAIIYEETKHRDELEEANRKAQLQLDTVTNAIPGGFKISKDDEKYSFKYISPKLAEMFGYSVKELYEVSNGNVEDWIKEEDREQAVRDVQTGYAVSDSYATKYRVKCKDNEWRWVSDHGRKVKQKDGSIEHYSFILDIDNEERQAEQIKEANAILKRERGQYREALLYECLYTFTFDLTVGYITEDYWLSTGENPIQFFNLKPPIHFDILVKELKKVISTDLNKEKEMDDLCVEGLLKNYQNGKKFYEFEYYANNMNSYQRMTILMTTNDENGHVTACVIGHDITEQKMQVLSARKALADANKELQIALFEAEKANSAKSQFLSRMSHDIRTPMNGILGMARIAKETIEDKERVLVALNKIEKAGKQLEMLINDVLDMSRLESGRTELAHKVFDINELLASGGDDLEEMIKDKKLRLKGSHFNNTHHMLIGSPLHLRRIIQNIISNAVKYNRVDGSLEAWLDEIPIDNKHSIFCFKVTDTGIGMSQEYIEHLFEPFSRGVNDAGTTYQGTGLGMAIVKELVDLMGGKIEVESELNVGTTFTLKIPFELYFGDIEKEEKEVEEDGNLEGMRFLVVEDNQLNMEIIQFILEEAGAVISMASDGKDAVEKFIHTPEGNYDVILMDIMMPVMDGLEATRRIRALEREDAKTIPIIAMTANAFTEDVFKSREAGMNDHLAKPIDVKLLMHTLKKYNKK